MNLRSNYGCSSRKISVGDVLSLIDDNSDVLIRDEDENILGGYNGRDSISRVLTNHVVSSIIFQSQRITIYITEETV